MTAIDVALAAAPLVVVPLCRPLLPRDRFPRPAIVGAAAVSFAAAFTVHQHASAVLALPWLAVASITLARIALDALHDRDLSIEALALVAAHGFLVVAAFFALASRAGWIVFGISDPIVELTGVHFHYAGFGR